MVSNYIINTISNNKYHILQDSSLHEILKKENMLLNTEAGFYHKMTQQAKMQVTLELLALIKGMVLLMANTVLGMLWVVTLTLH